MLKVIFYVTGGIMKSFIRSFSLFLIVCTLLSSCAIRKVNEEDTLPVFDNLTSEDTTIVEPSTDKAEITDTETTPATEPSTEIDTTIVETEPPATEPPVTEPPVTQPPVTQPPVTQPPATQPPVTQPPADPKPASADCLFIGDSRTEGLRLYSGVSADYFSNVGMSIYSIANATAAINGLGTVNFDTLMASKQYKRIFVMLGINEIGTPASSLVPKYKALIDKIKAAQPDACIFIEANLHVTNAFTQKSPHINNTAINNYNAELAKLADNSRVFYLDANFLFDDASGQLSTDKSSDGVHYYPKEYPAWAQWLLSQSASLMG